MRICENVQSVSILLRRLMVVTILLVFVTMSFVIYVAKNGKLVIAIGLMNQVNQVNLVNQVNQSYYMNQANLVHQAIQANPSNKVKTANKVM